MKAAPSGHPTYTRAMQLLDAQATESALPYVELAHSIADLLNLFVDSDLMAMLLNRLTLKNAKGWHN